MRGMIVAAALIAAGIPATAQAQIAPAAASRQPDIVVEQFFKTLQRGDAKGALSDLVAGSPLLAKNMGNIETLSAQIQFALTAYGSITSWEKIESEPLGTLIRRDTFLVQHRNMVTRWRFIYARTGDGWIVGSFAFEDQAPTWFD